MSVIGCGVSFLGDLEIGKTIELAQRAERSGVDSVWISETYFERDAMSTLAAIAYATNRVRIGTGVVPVFTRHPALLAMAFSTLQELSKGRVVAGVGAGVGNVMGDQLAYDYRSPLSAVREAVAIMREMLSGETSSLHGRVFTAQGVRMEPISTLSTKLPDSRGLPIHIAAIGPKMCALAGEIADGVHYAMPTPTVVSKSNEYVNQGVEKAGRDLSDVDRVAWIVSSVHTDSGVARDVAREHVAPALATSIGENLLRQEGFDPGLAQILRSAFERGGLREAIDCISDEVVDTFAAAGTPAQVAEKVRVLCRSGVTHPVLTAYGPHADQVLDVAAHLTQSQTSPK